MLLQDYPAEIQVNHCHNHCIEAADALRRRRPNIQTQTKFIDLLRKGHSPLSAMQLHKFDLKTEYKDNYYKAAADGSKCPSNFWVYKLSKKLNIKEYGPQCGREMIEALKKFSDDYNTEIGEVCCKVELVDSEEHLAVAICTPLMKRVHRLLPSAAEMMFVDSSGNMDCLNCRVFLLLAPSLAGAMPLGVLITTSESQTVIHNALELWKTLLPDGAFFGRGASIGPKLIMTDDAVWERNALKMAFFGSILLLCLFHVLQAFWRFVWNRDQNVPKEKRSEVFYLFKDMVYAPDKDAFESRKNDALNSHQFQKYPKIKIHVEDKLVPRSSEWALYERRLLLTRGNDTNNYCEANIRVLKDVILARLKAFNPVQLMDFLLSRYDDYNANRIIDVINNRALNPFKSRYYVRPEKLADLECAELQIRPNTYLVKNKSKGNEYYVLMDYEFCSCPKGQSGAPCKHMCIVVMKYKLSSSIIHPLLQSGNSKMKRILFEIAHGHCNVPEEWFAGLFDEVNGENQQQQELLDPVMLLHQDIPAGWFDSIFNTKDTPVNPDDVQTTESNTSDNDNPASESPQKTDSAEVSTQAFPPDLLLKSEDELNEIFNKWVQKLRTNPQMYYDPVQVFINQNKKLINSESGLVSAMHSFGKGEGPLPLRFKHSNQCDIPVQPTSRARRTVRLGGKRCQFSGRPPNAEGSLMGNQNPEHHTYGGDPSSMKRKPHEAAYLVMPKRRYAAPHKLALQVQNSQSNGGNHSRK